MPNACFTPLPARGIIAVEGEDKASFLQGLVSNDVERVSANAAIHAALLSPQGKYLHDFFIAEADGRFLIDCERDRLPDLLKRLGMYKLRAKVTLTDESESWTVAALVGTQSLGAIGPGDTPGAALPLGGGVAFTDPRLAEMGGRAILPASTATETLSAAGLHEAPFGDFDALRIALGLPDGSRDLVVEKSILLENGFDELNGVDWNKGCYMGQELTARTKYRGLIKKRLMPVAIDGEAPEPGAPIMAGDKEAGEMRSHAGSAGLALMRLEALETGGPFQVGAVTLTPRKPDWANF